MNQKYSVKSIALKYSWLFVVAGILSYVLSKLVIKGSELITDAINTIMGGNAIDIGALAYRTMWIIIVSMILTFVKTLMGESFSIKVQRNCKNITVETLEKIHYGFF